MSKRPSNQFSTIVDLPHQLRELWQHGQKPDVQIFLLGAGSLPAEKLVAILLVDQEQRWLNGDRVRLETYLRANPVLAEADALTALLYHEFLLRKAGGEDPDLEEYAARFPKHADRLRQQLQAHQTTPPDVPTRASASPAGTIAFPGTDAGASPAFVAMLMPVVPGYSIVRELGRGGMGVVYEAIDQRRRQHVALKMMQWADPASLYLFKQEFRSLADLSHPNLVALYDLVVGEGTWFFTMELLAGVGFLSHVRGGMARHDSLVPAGVERLRAVLPQLVAGVSALHAAGKLHRDIKPGNVMVDPATDVAGSRLVLLDLGLAVDLSQGHYDTVHPRLVGTLPYMAPEQAACQSLTPATDWYSVGAVIYEALTGQPPFKGSLYEILRAKKEDNPLPPGHLVASAPADLAALAMELLHRDPAARPTEDEISRRLGLSRAVPAVSEVPFVGRVSQLATLADALQQVSEGHTVVVSVHGRSGAGKSALVRHFLDECRNRGDVVVLAGRCYEQEAVPYKALDSLIDSLSRYLASLPAVQVDALLPRDLPALMRLFPVLARVESASTHLSRRAGQLTDPNEIRRRALTGLRELLTRVGDRHPLILSIDDLQWGDADSALVLADILQPPDPPPLLLLACYRREDTSSPCLLAFQNLCQLSSKAQAGIVCVDVPVDPLGQEECALLARSLLGHDRSLLIQAELIARQSGGYPFFVLELVQHLQQGKLDGGSRPPDSMILIDALASRVQALPATSRRLLEVLAVAGRPVDPERACRAAGLGSEDRQALAQLRAVRLVRVTSTGTIETYHDRVRETVQARLGQAERARHHRQLAEQLEQAGVDPETLAIHFLGAGQRDKAARYSVEAGDQAAAALAFDRAVKLYRQALELGAMAANAGWDERALRIRLADALTGAGRGAEAAREYLQVSTGPEKENVELRGRAALQFLRSGHVDQGLSVLREVLSAVGLTMHDSSRSAFWGLVWQRILLLWRGLKVRSRKDPATERAKVDVCAAAAVGLSMVDNIQGAYFQTQALRLALDLGEPGRLVVALVMQAAHESIGGTRGPKRRINQLMQVAQEQARTLSDPYPPALMVLMRGLVAALAGEWPTAAARCDEAEIMLRESCNGVTWELGTAWRFGLWPRMAMGEVPLIADRLPRLIKESQERDDRYGVTNLCLVVRTFVRLAHDEPARARHELHEVMEGWSQHGFHVQHMNCLHDEVLIDLYQGAASSGLERLRKAWGLLERSHLLRIQQVFIFLVHLRGRCALAAGDLTQAQRDARTLLREGADWATALGLLLQAGVAAQRERAQAISLLEKASQQAAAVHMHLHALAARYHLGRLLGGSAGAEMHAAAEAQMRARQVAAPERMARMLVPGFREEVDPS